LPIGFLASIADASWAPFMMSTYSRAYGTPTSSSIHTTVAARENGW
jgi:hypothetical protein